MKVEFGKDDDMAGSKNKERINSHEGEGLAIPKNNHDPKSRPPLSSLENLTSAAFRSRET